jgi:hypothetical protein
VRNVETGGADDRVAFSLDSIATNNALLGDLSNSCEMNGDIVPAERTSRGNNESVPLTDGCEDAQGPPTAYKVRQVSAGDTRSTILARSHGGFFHLQSQRPLQP